MHEIAIDDFDRAILRALQRDASLTNAALGEMVSLSASQCSRRRSALEKSGVIEGYAARLDPAKLGLGFRAITRVNLKDHDQKSDDAFTGFLRRQPQVRAAHSVSGDADYVLEILVSDLGAFADFVHNHLLPHPTVAQVRSDIVLTSVKRRWDLPLG